MFANVNGVRLHYEGEGEGVPAMVVAANGNKVGVVCERGREGSPIPTFHAPSSWPMKSRALFAAWPSMAIPPFIGFRPSPGTDRLVRRGRVPRWRWTSSTIAEGRAVLGIHNNTHRKSAENRARRAGSARVHVPPQG